MSAVLRTLALSGIALFCTVLLRECGFKGYKLLGALGVIGIIGLAVSGLGESLLSLLGYAQGFGIDGVIGIAIKAIGIGYAFGIASDICKEMGEAGIGSALELAGRVELLALSVPVIKELLELAVGLIDG